MLEHVVKVFVKRDLHLTIQHILVQDFYVKEQVLV